MAGLRALKPHLTPDVGGLIRDPEQHVRDHFVQLSWWLDGLVAFATLVGFATADPRLVRLLHRCRDSRVGVWLSGKTRVSAASAWRKAMIELAELSQSEIDRERSRDDTTHTYVGALMSDGTYVAGHLVYANTNAEENEEREIILTQARLTTRTSRNVDIGSRLTIISARHITRLDITHLRTPNNKPVPARPHDEADGQAAKVPAE